MDPLKLRDMRMPISMRPAIPSQVLALVILESVHEKLMEAGGSVVFTTPFTTAHTESSLSITYTEDCRQQQSSLLDLYVGEPALKVGE